MSDRLLRLSFFVAEDSNIPKTVEVTWDQLAAQLQAPVVAPCTLAEGPDKCVGAKCPHKLGQAWCAAAYPPGLKRGKKNVAAVSVLVIDLDHMTDVQLGAVAVALQPYKYVVHATHSDREATVLPDGTPVAEDRCLRVVIALSAPVAGADWDRFWLAAIEKLALPLAHKRDAVGGIDAPTRDASRLFFLPSRQADRGFLAAANEGAELDVAEVLAAAAPLETPVENVLPGATSVASAETIQAAALKLAAAWPPPRSSTGGGGRHYAFLALAGALATHGWPADAITMLTTYVARLMPGSDEKAIADRHPQAVDSVTNVQRGAYVTSWGTLAGYLTRPEVIDEVRVLLGMRDMSDLAFDAMLGTPAPTAASEAPTAYPSLSALDAIDLFKANPLAVPEVTAEPGTFLHHLQQARQDVARQLSSKVEHAAAAPLFHSARDLFTMDFPATSWIVKGLLTEGGVGAILAEAKSAKSWLAIEIALSVSSGLNLFGLERFWVPKAMPVAYFFAEDQPLSVRNRIRAFASGRGLPPETMSANLHVQPRGQHLDLTKDEDIARIVASCRAIGNIGLLILDPLRDLHSGAENESDDMSEVFAKVRALGTILKCTVLLVHHAKRASKDKAQDDARPGTDARGSSAIEGALDAIIAMRDLRGNGENVFSNNIVTQIKNAKSAGKFPLTLTIRDDKDGFAEDARWTIGEDAVATGGSQSFDELVIAILEHMAIAELKKERAQTTDLIRKAVTRKYELVAAGLIQAEKDGYVLPNKVGNKLIGWLLTDRGREHVRTANAVPAPVQTIPVEQPDPRLSGGFGLRPE